MKKIITLFLVFTIAFSTVYSKEKNQIPPKKFITKGKLNEKSKETFGILEGIIIKYVLDKVMDKALETAITYVEDYLNKKNIAVIDENHADNPSIEVITININDTDNDGYFELSSESEDHDKDGNEDNITEAIEYDNYENGIDKVIDNQLEYIDQFYQGDLDGDGSED